MLPWSCSAFCVRVIARGKRRKATHRAELTLPLLPSHTLAPPPLSFAKCPTMSSDRKPLLPTHTDQTHKSFAPPQHRLSQPRISFPSSSSNKPADRSGEAGDQHIEPWMAQRDRDGARPGIPKLTREVSRTQGPGGAGELVKLTSVSVYSPVLLVGTQVLRKVGRPRRNHQWDPHRSRALVVLLNAP